MERVETSTVLYSDLNKNPAKNNASLAYNLDAIKQSLDNLFNTPYGTRSFQPTYGNTFYYILGEPMNEDTVRLFYNKVIESVSIHEPRVNVDTVNSSVTPLYEENAYWVTLVFTVSGLSTNDKFAYDIKILNSKEQ
uniref:Baseplate wedge protein n=1 Tax=Siphoviridae sp. ctYh54 TaxID=2826379 RepID=A0A8S5MEP5_9CAUD|nr:MAG TPA: Baseplate wedge protein [Siphoviridae sp. ctYh54]